MIIHHNNEYELQIGWWELGRLHGYGKKMFRFGEVHEGLFERGQFVPENPDYERTYSDDDYIA